MHEFGPLGDGAANSRSAYVHDPDGHLVEFWTADMDDYGDARARTCVASETAASMQLDAGTRLGEDTTVPMTGGGRRPRRTGLRGFPDRRLVRIGGGSRPIPTQAVGPTANADRSPWHVDHVPWRARLV